MSDTSALAATQLTSASLVVLMSDRGPAAREAVAVAGSDEHDHRD